MKTELIFSFFAISLGNMWSRKFRKTCPTADFSTCHHYFPSDLLNTYGSLWILKKICQKNHLVFGNNFHLLQKFGLG